jgi:hypothetical protein
MGNKIRIIFILSTMKGGITLLPSICSKDELPILRTSPVINIPGTFATSGCDVASKGSGLFLENGI